MRTNIGNVSQQQLKSTRWQKLLILKKFICSFSSLRFIHLVKQSWKIYWLWLVFLLAVVLGSSCLAEWMNEWISLGFREIILSQSLETRNIADHEIPLKQSLVIVWRRSFWWADHQFVTNTTKPRERSYDSSPPQVNTEPTLHCQRSKLWGNFLSETTQSRLNNSASILYPAWD